MRPRRLAPFLLAFFALLCATASLRAATSATFSWNPSSDSSVIGYRLYYGPVADPYTKMVDVKTTSATVSKLISGTTYAFAVTAYDGAGAESAYSSAIYYTPGGAATATTTAPSLDNISSRMFVQTGDNVMIGGFIIQGDTPKKVILRAIGPSLSAAGITDALQDPVLELWDSTGSLIVSKDNWDPNNQDLISTGMAPTDPRESAIVATLPAGAYSAILRGKNSTTGVALFELYDLDRGVGSVANISTRGKVETADKVMIGGFILGGTEPTKVIVRAIGPSLAANGVQNALLDPTLELYDGNGSLVSQNDNWRSDQESAIIDSNVAPTDDFEAAIIATLSPGAYSAIVRGANNTTGVALFEVYALTQ